jgi:alkylation response protein AidB-like acyl-CoA dehydrogenase
MDRFDDIRDGIRALCAQFPAEYHRNIDRDRGYPDAFVEALTREGWMAALIPEEYGGSGLGSGRGLCDYGRDQSRLAAIRAPVMVRCIT